MMQQPELPELEEEQPTTPEFKPGDLVVCIYRLPSETQPWVAPFWVGTIEEPGDSIEAWNGRNSERFYCEKHKKARVRYSDGYRQEFVQRDRLDSLRHITPEQAALTPIEKVRTFLGEEAYQNWLNVSNFGRETVGYAVGSLNYCLECTPNEIAANAIMRRTANKLELTCANCGELLNKKGPNYESNQSLVGKNENINRAHESTL